MDKGYRNIRVIGNIGFRNSLITADKDSIGYK